MKTQMIKKVNVLILAILMITGSGIYAQQGRGTARQGQRTGQGKEMHQRRACLIPDLSEEQKNKIESLRLEQMKEMTSYRNQLNELKAKKKTLMSTASDLKEIYAVIDSMTELNNKKMKTTAKHMQNFRNLLTEEQKVFFDSKPQRRHANSRAGRSHGNNRRGKGQMRRII